MEPEQVAQLLVALVLLLACAHVFGWMLVRLHQPRVIGEILGGIVLGPTLLLQLAPGLIGWVFPADGPSASILAGTYQLGLLLLMYLSGSEMRSLFAPSERKIVGAIALGGTVVPFIAGLVLTQFLDVSGLQGPSGTHASLVLLFCIAIAVTSIPVISRIMFDLGVIGTSFARIVLGAAVIEDIVLYVALAVALGLASSDPGQAFGLPALLPIGPGAALAIGYHVVAELALLVAAIGLGGARFSAFTSRLRKGDRIDPVAKQILVMLGASMVCAMLGIVPLFGAFAAGLAAGASTNESVLHARDSIKRFSFAYFVPLYFALVGFQLDLLREFDPWFFLILLAFASIAKATSVYVSARVVGEQHSAALNLSVAMNARGGPGIVLASVAFGAGIISATFFASLILLAVVTSLFAGSWLGYVVRGGRPLREAPDARNAEMVKMATPAPTIAHTAGPRRD